MRQIKHLLLALALVAGASSAWAVDCQLWVNGTQITDANCADITAVSGGGGSGAPAIHMGIDTDDQW